jgi:hypothetical protein
MTSNDQAMRQLARLLSSNGGTAVSDREEGEAILLPMIRVAMRTGRGEPVLVEWVEDQLLADSPASNSERGGRLEWAAPRLARLLFSEMQQHIRAGQARAEARETLVGV